MKFFIDRSSLGRFARNLIMVVIVFMATSFSVVYSILGLIDLTVNLRKINRAV